MKKNYKDILATLSEQPTMSQDDRILLVDGLNLFFRNFTINPSQNEHGVPVGGIKGFLLGLGAAIKQIRPTRVIICFDGRGGSARRRKLYPDYKAKRRPVFSAHGKSFTAEDTKILMSQQLSRLTDYLSALPVTVMATENIEADDAIAYISKQIYPDSTKYIMSTDKDFLQLVDEKCCVWSPTKKVFYFDKEVKDMFGIMPQNLAILRAILGDKSDNIVGLKGAGIKTLKKAIPELFADNELTLTELRNTVSQYKKPAKVCTRLLDEFSTVELNYRLMQLYDVEVSAQSKESLINIVRKKSQGFDKPKFIRMLNEDAMWLVKDIELYLRTVWHPIEAFNK